MPKGTPTPSLFSRIINVAPHEASRVLLAWTLKCLLFAGQTVGWTMLTALLVIHQGIDSLPLLYVASAALVMLGTIVFAELSHVLPIRRGLFVTALSGSVLVGAALALLFLPSYFFAFFCLSLIAYGVFFSQLKILLGLFTEHLFSPLESERAFPVVETAEYVGGITGGISIIVAMKVFEMPTQALAFIWGAFILAMLPFLMSFYGRKKKLPGLTFAKKNEARSRLFTGAAGSGFREVKRLSFLKGLALFLLMQSFLVTLINYQFTSAIEESAMHGTVAEESDVHAAAAKSEEILTESLGGLHILFSFCALFFQLLITSRLLERFGIVRSMQAHPVATFVASLPFAFMPGMQSASIMKGVAEVTGGMFFAGYHASLYAIPEETRRFAKEFLDGIAYPLGAVLATCVMLIVTSFLPHHESAIALSVVVSSGLLLMAVCMMPLARHYTLLTKRSLELAGDHPDKFTAVEVLSQRGHVDAASLLRKNLLFKRESPEMKVKILETLSRLRAVSAIPDIVTCFSDQDIRVILAAVRSLESFDDLGREFFGQAFTRHRVVSALQDLFRTANSKELRSHIVRVFASLKDLEIVPFLLEALRHEDAEVRADSIYVCGLFHDVSVAHYLEPFLTSEDPFVRAATISALWQFPQYRLKLTILLAGFIEAKDMTAKKALAHLLGEIGAIQEKPRLIEFTQSPDDELRLLAALALAKMDHADAPDIIADFVLHEDAELAHRAKKHLALLPQEIRSHIEEQVHRKLSERLTHLMNDLEADSLEEVSHETLHKLKSIYLAAGEMDEAAKITALLA